MQSMILKMEMKYITNSEYFQFINEIILSLVSREHIQVLNFFFKFTLVSVRYDPI